MVSKRFVARAIWIVFIFAIPLMILLCDEESKSAVRICVYALLVVLVVGYVACLKRQLRDSQSYLYGILMFHLVKMPLFVLLYAMYCFLLVVASMRVCGLSGDIH